jgi:pyruvate-ferredoxin/flavodoxin oxidoreductase
MEPRKKIDDVLKKFPFPGIATVTDGSEAIVWIESHITQGGCLYPITPTEKISNLFKQKIESGFKNIWGEEIYLLESDSARNTAAMSEGFALAGGRVSNFSGGPGLVSMKDVMFSISGKRLPMVFNIGTRSLTSQSSCINTSHDDVMAISDCGWGMMFAKNVQEAADFALISRRVAEDSYTPFLNVQDGFHTTHVPENVNLPEPELMKQFIGDPGNKLVNFFNPTNPIMTGVHQNQDCYMKGKIAQRDYYEKIPAILKSSMEEYYELTGRKYDFVDKYLLDDAEYAIVGFGAGINTAMEACDWTRKNLNIKAGTLNISVFRPFPKHEIIEALSRLKAFTVIERMDNPLASDNPLSMEIKSSFMDLLPDEKSFDGRKQIKQIPEVYSCSYGIGGRETEASSFVSIIKNMHEKGRRNFSIGVEHSYSIDGHTHHEIDRIKLKENLSD